MGDHYPRVRVAAVQAAPVFLNREASIEKACRLIREAGAAGAKLIGFPEGFIPGHPIWYHFRPATDAASNRMAAQLFANSVQIPGRETDQLAEAAREAGAYVVMGLCEKLPGTFGTMFNTLLYIGPDGRLLGKHQKLVPTVGERLVHAGGYGDTIGAFDTTFGKVGGLICGESLNPLLIFALLAEQTQIHVVSWPSRFQKGGTCCPERAQLSGRAVAAMSKSFVINCIGAMSDEMCELFAYTEEDKAILADPTASGGSCVINPRGDIIAGPLGPEEGILYAEIDLAEGVLGKIEHDFAGHYNRPDVFHVTLETQRPLIYRREGAAAEASTATLTDALAEADGMAPANGMHAAHD
ncbi:MAG TPA: carbon-nitrogen hydrolase family protein [Ktedonobacterales bacterium]|nr:carbon-nitrogen hydrolase family protein [Ktedonobacterales bacterium]